MSALGGSVTIVTQTCVREGHGEDFACWQGETSTIIAGFPGFMEQRVLPPNPPLQVDWVILQTFASLEQAQRWLASPERQKRIEGIGPLLVGRDDVHIMRHGDSVARSAVVSAVISTRVKPGKEAAYHAWEHRIAAAQSKAPGLQGYRFEPPMPGIQDDYVAYLRFDSEANLNAWLDSPARKKLLDEAADYVDEFHARIVRTGFDHWFGSAGAGTGSGPAPWQMNMLVLLLLYPIVFLFGYFVQGPFLTKVLHLPFSMSLFASNVVSTVCLAFSVPVLATQMRWWLQPAATHARRTQMLGAILIIGVYLCLVAVFTRFF